MAQAEARVLFLTSAAFNKVTGGGITFTNLFAGWPRDSIATIHNDPVPTSNDICSRYYKLSEAEIHRWGWLRHISLGKAPSSVVPEAAGTHRHSWKWAVLKRVKTWVFGDAIPEVGEISPQLAEWVAEFRPTVIYTILGSNAMMELAECLRTRFNLPLVIHIMDDWVSVLYKGGFLSPWQRRKKERLMQHLVDVAAARLVICDEMAEAYRLRYRQPFLSFQNAIDVGFWGRYAKTDLATSERVRVAYIGSVFPFAQLESLVDCCRAVQALDSEGFPIRLDIYSPAYLAGQFRQRLVVGPAISLHDTITDDAAFFRTLNEADILLLPVNFDDYTIEYIRFSMPTKVPAYLATGTPILAYGPAEVAQISYAASAGWGMTVTRRDTDFLRQSVRQLASDMQLRRQLSARARDTAAERHDSQVVASAFQATLASAAWQQDV